MSSTYKTTPCQQRSFITFPTFFRGAAVAFAFVSIGASAAEEDKRAVMFERVDVVEFAEKEIPEFFQRTEITDLKNRSIKGKWVSIDRANQKVKFQREDGQEYDIGFDQLSPRDRRYAELETGWLWQIDPLPTPIDLINEDILGFDSMDETHVHLRCVHPNDPSIPYVPKFQINLLTAKDRALIKEKTGREIKVLPRPEPDGNRRAWNYPKALFGHQVPKFSEGYYPATMRLMRKTYSPEEMVDAVRTRTMNSSFIHEYYEQKHEEAEPKKKTGTKSLAEVLVILGKAPSPVNEEKSIKPIFKKLNVEIYEEKVPRDPAEPERFERNGRSVLAQPGVPIDGELQAYFFIAQYMRLATGKPRIPLASQLDNTPYRFTGVDYTTAGQKIEFTAEQRRKHYHTSDILPGIEKTFGYKAWKVFSPEKMRSYLKPGEAVRDIYDQINYELIRNHIRKGMPVYGRVKQGENIHRATQLVITGFKAQRDKPLMIEAIAITGSYWGNDPNVGEYEIAETTIPASELDTLTVTYLELP